MSSGQQVVIVGAGPAGIRAAQTLVGAGIRPIVLDENARWGGQIYRQPPADAGFTRSKATLYGFESKKADAVHETMRALLPHIDYRPDTLVWSCEGRRLDTIRNGREASVAFTQLIVASGATDRVLPVPGWTLPGVYTLGGAQVALKAQGSAIGRRVVLAGTGPLLYLVAYQYVKAGARIEAVLDTSAWSNQVAAVPKLISQPSTFAKGVYYVAWLKARGVRVERGVTLVGIDGEEGVAGIRFKRSHENERVETIACDAVGLGFGLRPETQLADLAGCRFRFDALNGCWLPERDAAGRSSVPGIYLAGDGVGIAGADAAELAGRRAALALLDDLGIAHPAQTDGLDAATLERRLQRIAVFRAGIEAAFAPPSQPAKQWPDHMTVCRCEEVDAGTLRRCIRGGEASEINRLKALTRVGMGRCQGRMCGEAAIALLSEETGRPVESVGRLRSQAPIKPIPISPMLFDDDVAAIPEEARDE
ncbi:NADPH-dependent 2,4-dienoyl-CoA reductase, sulfur reductase [Paraburkholderia steynii]|uniref:NADPH-dependent 2,4-dienoyl-CoA reductase, sulfur reductase n=1 Tax=Paraburkholderia steynii TaxID=1245441 RepID=A0A7Z7BHY5_9BURK|nr:FAD/NAD(P)-binding oxidoreductase [Paraburkholderia steynii]SDJ28581.1 NADPH-dependent 2,4-dienoyl-CoA reductase, sulfur reductase [Paraburkholderia steynii]